MTTTHQRDLTGKRTRKAMEVERRRVVAWLDVQLRAFPDPDEPMTTPDRDVDHEMALAAADTIRNIRDAIGRGVHWEDS